MQNVTLKITFNSLTFLGDADQSSVMRIPSFKGLFRYSWRIIKSETFHHDYSKMRESEGKIFGNAWLEQNNTSLSTKSHLIMWISSKNIQQLNHIKTTSKNIKEFNHPFNPLVYIGFGPITLKGELKASPAINEGSTLTLNLLFNENELSKDDLRKILLLLHWIGTIGAKNRNGFGSFMIASNPNINFYPSNPLTDLSFIMEDWKNLIKRSWVTGIGSDNKGALIWRTDNCNSSDETLKKLARIKARLKKCFSIKGHNGIGERFVLGYPVAKASSIKLKGLRLPSQLRMKVIRKETSGYYGLIAHLPSKIPEPYYNMFINSGIDINNVWEKAHSFLDDNLKRIRRNADVTTN